MELRERIEIIAEIARRKQGRQGRLGKTAMMKLLFLLQEAYGVDLGYRFSLYTYGPYVSAVMSDIDFAEASGAVRVLYTDERGYQIDACDFDPERISADSVREALDALMSVFGDMTARDLELRSTILFLVKSNTTRGPHLASTVQQIKPKFSMAEITSAIDDLRARQMISVAVLHS